MYTWLNIIFTKENEFDPTMYSTLPRLLSKPR